MKKTYFPSSFMFKLSLLLFLGCSSNVSNAMHRRGQQAVIPGVGIQSGQNGCYFNATMQCLTNCLPDIDATNANIQKSEKDIIRDLTDLKHDIAALNNGSVDACDLRDRIIQAVPDEFTTEDDDYPQADAAALVNYFLPLIKASGCNAFTIPMQSAIVRPECKHKSIRVDDPALSLELPIDGNQTIPLATCFENYFDQEEMDTLRCGKCNRLTLNGTKQLGARGLPQILVLQLKRFVFIDNNNRQKINTHVTFPLENFICTTVEYENNPSVDHEYALMGFIQHRGVLGNGHYTAYVKRNGQWYFYDDKTGYQVTLQQITRIAEQGADGRSTPYIFFYELAGDRLEEADEHGVEEVDEEDDDDNNSASSDSDKQEDEDESSESFEDKKPSKPVKKYKSEESSSSYESEDSGDNYEEEDGY